MWFTEGWALDKNTSPIQHTVSIQRLKADSEHIWISNITMNQNIDQLWTVVIRKEDILYCIFRLILIPSWKSCLPLKSSFTFSSFQYLTEIMSRFKPFQTKTNKLTEQLGSPFGTLSCITVKFRRVLLCFLVAKWHKNRLYCLNKLTFWEIHTFIHFLAKRFVTTVMSVC